MDILYIVGTGSSWNDNELRYSLRSIAQNGGNIGRVFIVGHKPSFVSDEVHFLPCDDPYPWEQRHKNILRKVMMAIENTDIAQHFLVSSDDHFYIKPTNFETLPVYHRADSIPDGIPFDHRNNPYFHSLVETRALLERHGLPIYQTNPHCNTHFDADVYRKNKAIFDECFRLPHGGEMNCVMGNLLIQAGYVHEHFNDSKLSAKTRSTNWTERVGDANCVSGVPRIGTTYLANYLIRHFPNKCIYEK